MPSRRAFLAGVGGLATTAGLSAPARAAGAPTLTWEQTYAPGNTQRATVRALVPMDDGIALVGNATTQTQHRGWVGAVDDAGRSHWHHLMGTGRSGLLAGTPAVDDTGSFVAVGVANAPRDVSEPESSDPYVVRAGSDGTIEWARTYQPTTSDGQSNAIARLGDGYVVAGSETVARRERPWAVRIDASGTRTWRWRGDRAGSVTDAIATADGVLLGGATWPPGSEVPEPRGSQEAAWIAQLTPAGDIAWQWRADRPKGDRIEGLAPRPDGGLVAVGRRGFATDDRGVGWLVALDANGKRQWEQTSPQDAWNWLNDVAAVPDGYLLAGTRVDEPEAERRGAWLLRVTATGQVDWEYQASSGTRGRAAHPLPDGGILVGGDRSGATGDRTEAWLAKLGGASATDPVTSIGRRVPELPGWTGPFVAGGVLGALGAGAAAYWR